MKRFLSPYKTVVTNFERHHPAPTFAADHQDCPYDETIWVLEVAASDQWVSCGLSNGDVNVYDQEQLKLIQSYPKLPAETCSLTDLTTRGEHLFSASFSNGKVCVVDVRQPKPALAFNLPRGEQALSVSLGYDGVLAAVGSSKPLIHFHDLRKAGSLLGTYQDAHTEEVVRVRFQSSQSPFLITGSEDGLVCVFDTSKPSEEAALSSVLNVEAPLRNVGFFGPSLEGVYCLTGSETLSVWHYESAQRICDFGSDIRQTLSKLADGAAVDYLVDCQWDTAQQQLSLLAGSHSGDAYIYRVAPQTLSLSQSLLGGHRGDVRGWCPLSNDAGLVTVGEDARMCEWNIGEQLTCDKASVVVDNSIPRSASTSHGGGGGPLRRPKKKNTASPY